MKPALTNCALPNTSPTIRGVTRRRRMSSNPINTAPPRNPTSGDVTIGNTTFGHRPMAAPFASSPCQINTDQLPPDVPIAAPHKPPIRAWLELDGNPSHQVKRFQMIAATNAQRTVVIVAALGSTSPELMVFATAVPNSAPIRFQNAAQTTATRGVSTFVETTVAMAFAVS